MDSTSGMERSSQDPLVRTFCPVSEEDKCCRRQLSHVAQGSATSLTAGRRKEAVRGRNQCQEEGEICQEHGRISELSWFIEEHTSRHNAQPCGLRTSPPLTLGLSRSDPRHPSPLLRTYFPKAFLPRTLLRRTIYLRTVLPRTCLPFPPLLRTAQESSLFQARHPEALHWRTWSNPGYVDGRHASKKYERTW